MIDINKNYNESNLETMAKMPECFVDLTHHHLMMD